MKSKSKINRFIVFLCLSGLVWGATSTCNWAAEPSTQQVFPTADAAVKTLVAAVQHDDTTALMAIFGPDGADIVSSGDSVEDRNGRQKFIKHVQEKCDLVEVDKTHCMLRIGKLSWAFPIPLVKSDDGWRFDTAVGRQEILNRRIGRNELAIIDFCHVFVDAQRAYADADGHGAYAQHFVSRPRKHDGLYWPVLNGQTPSPLGPAVAAATAQGYETGKHQPFYGYHFHMLHSQGPDAPTGAKNYINKHGRMTGGFALVAWPAEYGVSGVMTFMVNQSGIVYQKDLGSKTADDVKSIESFNPDASWKPVRTP